MTFKDSDIDWLTSIMAEAATQEIMPRFRRLSSADIRQKTSATDLVTEADVNAEKVMTRLLKQRYPNALVVGEEAHAEDSSILPRLGDADLAFVLDPVDGTINFASGIAAFGVMLAVVVKGETVAGIIHDPVGQDFILATRGGGAHIRHRDGTLERCRVAPPLPVEQQVGAVYWTYLKEPERSLVAGNHAKFAAEFKYRAAAVEYRMLATGHGHFVIYMKLMPWDHLPGTLIHVEAGGYHARLDGTPYLPSHVGGGLLAAPDVDSWHAIKRLLWSK